jgi:hypothetical protein
MAQAKKKPREETIKVRLSEAEKDKVTAFASRLSPPRTLSQWLRDVIWREVGL